MLKLFFLKRVRSFFVIMIIPNLLLFAVIGGFVISAQHNALQQKGPAVLNSIEEGLESSLYNASYQMDVMMNSPSYVLSLKNLLSQSGMDQQDRMFFTMLKRLLTSYEMAYSYIDSIYIYLDGISRFMTSATGRLASVDDYFDLEWLEEYEAMDPSAKVFTSRRWIQKNSFDNPLEVITIYYRNTYMDGAIVINVDRKKYGEMLRSNLISPEQQVVLFNHDGAVVSATDAKFVQGDIEQFFQEQIARYQETGDFTHVNNTWKKIDGTYYYLYIQHSEFFDVYQMSAIPLSYLFSEMGFYLWIMALILILNIVLVLVLAYSYTKRSFYYIEECVNVFSAAERGEPIERTKTDVQDEYGMILNNVIYMYLKNNQMQRDLLEKQHLYEMTEMTALQLQINPHFIFNTLQIMDFEVLRNLGTESTLHKMTHQLSQVVKYALTNPIELVTLREELDYLKAYLQIQEIRFHNNSITYFEIDDSLLQCKVFRLLLQPMLENCFKHADRGEEHHLLIKIKAYDRGDAVSFTVIDNGRGMDRTEVEELYEKINNMKSKSVGLTNLNRRLILHYGEESHLRIQSRKNRGTIISTRIPKQT